MKGYTKKQNRRRYRLHRKVKDNQEIRLQVRERTTYVSLDFDPNVHKYALELSKKFGYAIQTEIK